MSIKYLTKFNTETEYNEFLNSPECGYVNVSYVQETDENKYYKETHSLQVKPFTMEILQQCENDRLENISWWIPWDYIITYNVIRNGEQIYTNTFSSMNSPADMRLPNGECYETGDKIEVIIECSNGTPNSPFIQGAWFNTADGTNYKDRYPDNPDDPNINPDSLKIKISGNIMSIYTDDYIYATPSYINYNYQTPYGEMGIQVPGLFGDTYYLQDASELYLPTRGLVPYCYLRMFNRARRLQYGPDIKAKYLPTNACLGMFNGCTSLTDMPLILAETVEEGALDGMFQDCTSLVNTTQLHIKKIYTSFGNWMFSGCSSLVTAPVWNEDVELINMTYNYNWLDWAFGGCSSLEDMSTWNIRFNRIDAYNGVLCHCAFAGCPSLTNTPYWGLTYNASDNVYLETMYEDPWGLGYPPVDTIYFLFTTGQIDGPAERFGSLAQTGTIYLKTGSRYLPDGDLYGQLPCNLPTGWAVAEYVEPNTPSQRSL